MKKNETDEESFDHHPSKDTTLRCPIDAKLREKGYRIHERRKDNDPVWERGGKLFKQKDILNEIKDKASEKKK